MEGAFGPRTSPGSAKSCRDSLFPRRALRPEGRPPRGASCRCVEYTISGAEKGCKKMQSSYPLKFKDEMVKKLLPPNAWSAHALSAEIGVAQTTLSRWLREAESGSVENMKKKNKNKSKKKKENKANSGKTNDSIRRRANVPLEEKLQIVLEAAEKTEQQLGPFLRTKGLHESDLDRYREEVQKALSDIKKLGRQRNKDKQRLKEVEKELKRKEKALAEAAALLVLKKKVQAIWGDEDDDTAGKT